MFFCGLAIGLVIGAVLISACAASGKADEHSEKLWEEYEKTHIIDIENSRNFSAIDKKTFEEILKRLEGYKDKYGKLDITIEDIADELSFFLKNKK
mgnify:CR=1 FL=1